MDDFGIDRPELTGTLISMEFGPGGRIGQMWVANPNLPDENEEFQFVLSPINIGDEIAEDYFPGTILLGARTHPDDPWIVSRNARAHQVEDDEDPSKVTFEYEFSFLEEIEAVGRFSEKPGIVPQICWDLTLTNNGRTTVEIGELGFPFAMNNLLEGFAANDSGAAEMYKDRVHIHKYIGGAASYLFAQRLNAEAPGLLIFPGADTKWEFFNHVRASLNTPFRWDGIPVVYIHSRAAIEREEWPTWFNDHSTLILEPGESRTYQTCFVPTERDRFDSVNPILAACGQPAVRLLPGAVVPADVGIAVEVAGATPTRFFTDGESELETDSDEEGGFCFVKPDKPGALMLSFEDTKGRESSAHLLFTEPIDKLIRARAKWIVEHQIHEDPNSNLHHAILPTDIHSNERITAPDEFLGAFGVESSLADALFLAEKNTLYPESNEILTLERFVEDFLLDDLQNPADGHIGSTFADDKSVAMNFGRPQVYALAMNLFLSLARLVDLGLTPDKNYRGLAKMTWESLHRATNVERTGYREVLLLTDAMRRMEADGVELDPEPLTNWLDAETFPYYGDSPWSTRSFREVFAASEDAAGLGNRREESLRLAYAARSLSPSWWWYASDKRWLDEIEIPHPAMADKGEMCLGSTTAANSLMFFDLLDRDYTTLPDSYLRLAFGGLLAPWALVRSDGAGSMGFCPDAASKQFGMSSLTGDLGISLFAYLTNIASYVLPTRNAGVITFGCHFEMSNDQGKDVFSVRPWDGVGRRVVVRQIGLEVEASFGMIKEVKFDSRKRWVRVTIHNPAAKGMNSTIVVRGMWGTRIETENQHVDPVNGQVEFSPVLLPDETREIEFRVTS